MQVLTRSKPSPADLKGFVKAGTYRAQRSGIFGTIHQWRHFMRTRGAEMSRRGLMLETTAGALVHEQLLDEALPALLAQANWPLDEAAT